MGGVAFDKSKSDPTLSHAETHAYFSTTSSLDTVSYLLKILGDISKIGGTKDGDYDKEWFFEPPSFHLEMAASPSEPFTFARGKYAARLEIKNDQYSPIDFGQFITGMRSGILTTTANLYGGGQQLDANCRLGIGAEHSIYGCEWNTNPRPQYRFILADSVQEVDRKEIETLVEAISPLQQRGYASAKIHKDWHICNLKEYVWFSRDLIAFIKKDYLANATGLANNDWAKFLLIASVSNRHITYVPLKDHPDKRHKVMLERMEKNIKSTLANHIIQKSSRSL